MKQLLIVILIAAGSLAVNSARAQVRVNAHIGINERDYPGYTYYTYPAWRGHDHDRYYYEHYRPVFEREHRGYFRGRRFDHARYERDHRGRGNYDRRDDNRRHPHY